MLEPTLAVFGQDRGYTLTWLPANRRNVKYSYVYYMFEYHYIIWLFLVNNFNM